MQIELRVALTTDGVCYGYVTYNAQGKSAHRLAQGATLALEDLLHEMIDYEIKRNPNQQDVYEVTSAGYDEKGNFNVEGKPYLGKIK